MKYPYPLIDYYDLTYGYKCGKCGMDYQSLIDKSPQLLLYETKDNENDNYFTPYCLECIEKFEEEDPDWSLGFMLPKYY